MSLRINEFMVLGKTSGFSDGFDLSAPESGMFILIDKPREWTSFDVVNKIRRLMKVKKTGHCGTLDPMATGLLILAAGRATKSIDRLTRSDKTYQTEFTFGIETDTYDTDGVILEEKNVPDIGPADWDSILNEWTGDMLQIPPAYSAIKKNGIPLYKLARNGKRVLADPRPVHIFKIELISWIKPVLKLIIHCSKGTYIRSIAHDLGQRLGCGGTVSELRRLKIGDFSVRDAWTIPEFQTWMQNSKVMYAVH